LNEAGIDFDAIAGQGVSGLLVGAPLAATLSKGLIIVRRPGDEQKMTFPFDIRGEGKNILFVDECVRTGATAKRVIEKLDEFCKPYKLAGALFYNAGWMSEACPRTFFDGDAERPIIVLPDETGALFDKNSPLGIILRGVGAKGSTE
jgi:hypoxanthine phosphoribosyltransferase